MKLVVSGITAQNLSDRFHLLNFGAGLYIAMQTKDFPGKDTR